MKRRDHLTDLRKKSAADLVASLDDARRRVLELAFARAFRKQKNIHEARELHRSIARMETILREHVAVSLAREQTK
ncbi:50S ribosomal protein L29 [Candidatus Berkelbacteria bacterium]|nr:50S ribosomal protein L29 [Candidatus Berkelbacteria bacterium]